MGVESVKGLFLSRKDQSKVEGSSEMDSDSNIMYVILYSVKWKPNSMWVKKPVFVFGCGVTE